MKHNYTRLRLHLLFTVVLSTLAAAVLTWLIVELLVDGILQEPFARAFVNLVQSLFGQSEEAALTVYHEVVRSHKHLYIFVSALVVMLIAFYLALGRFTRHLNLIGSGLHQVAEEANAPLEFPAELAPLQAELSALQTTLQLRARQAKEAEERKNDLLVFLAHDLKTPLTSVIGYLTLLRDDPALSAQQRAKYTGIALDKALRLEDLLREFFEITRESLHQTPAETAEIQLSVLLEQLADEFMPQFQEKSLQCSTKIHPHLSVAGEADKLARVFDNVLRNAVSYSTEGGTVEIEACPELSDVVIAIRNEGLEIPEQELARIFQKFYRLDTARSTRTGGAGLGLAIAREIVEQHGGTIRAEANGKKTSFIIRLPKM